MEIRELQECDRTAFIELDQICLMHPSAKGYIKPHTATVIDEFANKDRFLSVGMFNNDDLVGSIQIRKSPKDILCFNDNKRIFGDDKSFCHATGARVHPDFRQRKLATMMLEHSINQLKKDYDVMTALILPLNYVSLKTLRGLRFGQFGVHVYTEEQDKESWLIFGKFLS